MKTFATTIEDLIAKNVFYIPPFQRPYAWSKVQLERFFDDILRVIKSDLDDKVTDKLEHFFGTVVLKEEKEGFNTKYIVVDGQQRLTTTVIFLIALRDSEKDNQIKNSITNKYLKDTSSGFEDKIKLKQVTKDWEEYKALVNNLNSVPKGIIKNAYETFNKLIKELKSDPLINTYTYIRALQRMNLAVIILDERPHKGEDPQIIFETLNSLGKPLILSDLARNYVLLNLNSKHQTSAYETIWFPKIEKPLGENTSNFIRDYLQYKTSTSLKVVNDFNTKELYQIFKNFTLKFTNWNDFIDDITKYSKLYNWIITEVVQDTISTDNTNDQTIKELIRNIFHDIKSEAFKPFVLGLLEYHQEKYNNRLDDKKLIEILKYIRTYLIRRRILGLTQGENQQIVLRCEYIPELVMGNIHILEIFSEMSYNLRLPNDNEIKTHLKYRDFYNNAKSYVKFVLGKIEEYNSKVSVDFRNSKISIEHIMPKKLTPEWESELGVNYQRIHNEYLDNIGNLILTEFNREMGSMPFSQKRQQLLKSNLSFRMMITKNFIWNEDTILEHQENMINLFLDTFPLPAEYKYRNNWRDYRLDLYDADVQVIFPSQKDAPISAEGRKPKFIIICDNKIEVKTWRDVLVSVVKYVKDNYDFNQLLDRDKQKYIFGREDAVCTWKSLQEKIYSSLDKNLVKEYKTLDEYSTTYGKNIPEDTYLVHIHMSTSTCVSRIARIMEVFDIPDDSVQVELRSFH